MQTCTLRKHAYSNILKISPPKAEGFPIENSDVFIFLLGTWIVGARWNRLAVAVLASTPRSVFSGANGINNVYPCKPQFYDMKVGFKGGRSYVGMFS